jgi:pyridoxal biosynthesis lyase PdxS
VSDGQTKADAGREAMLRMVAGFEAIARSNAEVVASNQLVAATNQELAASNQELSAQVALLLQHEAALMEHLASLQRQVAALTVVEARRGGVPVEPEDHAPLDPIGALGHRVVNGIFGMGHPDQRQPRRRR